MSEPENFLTRWSRRKRVAEQPDKPTPAADAAPETLALEGEPAPVTTKPPAPAFDPASLPSLDSIGAQTDISAFLKVGVPPDLRLAALRRAWSADPAIRDFKGLAENDWDFNDPNGILGFGKLDPGTDVKKMLAQLFGETPRVDEPPTEISAQAEQLTPPSNELSAPSDRPALDSLGDSARDSKNFDRQHTGVPETNGMVQRDENIAAQKDDTEFDDAPIKRRPQGGALPR